jgi:FecR protein
MLPRLALTFALAAFVCPVALGAQSPQYPQSPQPELATDGIAPAHVSLVEGAVSLEREGRAETSPLNMPLLSGDRLRTADGRVEVLFADGSALHLDMRSTIDVQSDDLVRLTEGRLRLNIVGPGRTVAYRIDSPAGSARITQPGEYRIALLKRADETQLELAVVRGAAEVFTDQGATPVRAGERAYASAGLAPSYAYAYNSANWDAFDRWSEAQRDVRLGVSSQYLPSDMQSYAPLLDESGDWRYTQSYGYAWYPRVAADWRPYYNGRWDSYPRYGWTWIGADRFAWPTHHYGRWGFSAGVWFWIPSSQWAPAYVSWGYAPGYVSWCPLGFDNRAIFSLDLYRVGPGYYSPWRGWTAVSSSHFGGRDSWVNQRAVNWNHVSGQQPRFEARRSAPGSSRDLAIPRNATPIRWAGSRNVVPESPSHGIARETRPAYDRGQARPGAGSAVARDSGRDAAPQRSGVTPRYVNRGDEIIRSQTERPSAPRPATPNNYPTRTGAAVPRGTDTRTVPEGPARETRPDFERSPSAGAQGRTSDGGPSRTRERQTQSYQPYQGPAREAGPRAYDRPGYQAQPAPQRAPERAAPPARAERAPSRAETPVRAPSRAEGRQPERTAPPSRAEGSSERATPRSGAAPPPRPGGRGGV